MVKFTTQQQSKGGITDIVLQYTGHLVIMGDITKMHFMVGVKYFYGSIDNSHQISCELIRQPQGSLKRHLLCQS